MNNTSEIVEAGLIDFVNNLGLKEFAERLDDSGNAGKVLKITDALSLKYTIFRNEKGLDSPPQLVVNIYELRTETSDDDEILDTMFHDSTAFKCVSDALIKQHARLDAKRKATANKLLELRREALLQKALIELETIKLHRVA